MEEQYPFLDENSKSWNREATATVNALMTGYIADGKEMDHALALAIKKIVPMYTEESTTPIKKEGTRRTKKARQKAVDADKRQPPPHIGRQDADIDELDLVLHWRYIERAFGERLMTTRRLSTSIS